MKLTIYQTIDDLDPNDIAENPEKSLQNYLSEVEKEIKKLYPTMEISCFSFLGSTTSWNLKYNGNDRNKIMDDIQKVMETVYEVGNFWE